MPENDSPKPAGDGDDKPAIPNPPAMVPASGGPPPIPRLASSHTLQSFPVAVLILLHFFTCGIFTIIWLNLMHGRLPKVRSDDPSAGRAVGFCFIPFFNLYWIFFTFRRLCLRVDEQRNLHGLPASNLTGMATAACIMQVIPYVNLLGFLIATPLFAGLVQSSVNTLAETCVKTPPRATLPAQPSAAGMPGWAIALVVCGCLAIPMTAIMAGLLLPALAKAKQKAQRIKCVGNLKQVGLAFRIWEGDHNDLYPFNISTNRGGTFEWCSRGTDGFDKNSWAHFVVLSNELFRPQILICPADTEKQPALDFTHFQGMNCSYWVHTGTNVSEVNPQQVLAICPIHRNVVFADGSVRMLTENQMQSLLGSVAQEQ